MDGQRRGSMAGSEMSVPAGGGEGVLLDPYEEVRRERPNRRHRAAARLFPGPRSDSS
jgi:hypothetical protein